VIFFRQTIVINIRKGIDQRYVMIARIIEGNIAIIEKGAFSYNCPIFKKRGALPAKGS
jgi:hypothetical protein